MEELLWNIIFYFKIISCENEFGDEKIGKKCKYSD